MAIVEGAFHPSFRTSVGISVPVLEPPRVPRIMDPELERPQSALTRGVTITEFRDARVNPEPVTIEESEYLLEEYLSPRKLRDLTGIDNLDEVKYLEMKVDTTDTSLGNFGIHLPNLKQLKLSNSMVASIRDLGSSLHTLQVLWMARCGMEDLDGLSSMNNLQELYLSYNDLTDISPCSMLENLIILDLEGNNIDELSQIHFLDSCAKLKNLTLEGNPVCVTPSPSEASPNYDYRQCIKEAIPHLQLLDDEPLVITAPSLHRDSDGPRRAASVFQDDWALIDELMADGTVAGEEDSVESAGITTARPPTSSVRPTTGMRPGTSSRTYTGTGLRPGSRSGRPATGARLHTASTRSSTGSSAGNRPGSGRPGSGRSGGRPDSGGRPYSGEDLEGTEDMSDLTRGGVVCGNPSKALRKRHKQSPTQPLSTAKIMEKLKFKPEHTYDVSLENDSSMRDLLDDLKEWKTLHSQKQVEIDARKAPQVLTISHDDAISLSDDDNESVDTDNDDEEDHKQALSAYSEKHLQRLTRENSINGGADSHSDARPKSRGIRDPSPRTKRRTNKLRYDESFEAPDEGIHVQTPEEDKNRTSYRLSSQNKSHSSSEVQAPSPVRLHDDDTRPASNPLPTNKQKFRLEGVVDKSIPKVIDRSNPVIRALPHSPESRSHDSLRIPPDSAKAALGNPATVPPPSRMRKGLANVQLLPSKLPSKFGK